MNYALHAIAFTASLLTATSVYAECDEHFDFTEAHPLVGKASGLNSGFVSNKIDIDGFTVALSAFDPNGHTWDTILALWGAKKNAAVVTKGCLDTNPDDPSD